MIFLFFFIIRLNNNTNRMKDLGLIIYFFFQRNISILLLVRIIYSFDKIIFLILSAKLGLFPFFYWIVITRIKVRIFINIFILSLQKFSVF